MTFALVVAMAAPVANANPPGIPQNLKLVFNFNYIAVPVGTHDNVGCGTGHRVFTEIGAQGQIEWDLVPGGGIGIDDCLTKSIDGTDALAHADQAGVYVVAVRVNAQQDALLSVCRKISSAIVIPSDLTCVVGFASLTKDKVFFTFTKKLFDLGNPEFWQLDPNTQFRVANFRLYIGT